MEGGHRDSPARERSAGRALNGPPPLRFDHVPDRQHLDDRQLDAILERLDRLCDEVHALNRRLDTNDQLQRIVAELGSLNESLQALAYAALGSQGPQVRRRRSA